jgi:hypothetical protein
METVDAGGNRFSREAQSDDLEQQLGHEAKATWDETAIERRTEALLGVALRIWSRPAA